MDLTTYCNAPLNPETRSEIIAACIQAQETLLAGLAQANAANFAGWMTLAAGGLALVGGASAYLAAVRQVRLTERRHQEETKAVRRHVAAIATKARNELKVLSDNLERNPAAVFDRHEPYRLPAVQALDNLISPQNWETYVRVGRPATDHFDRVWLLTDAALDLMKVMHQLFSENGPYYPVDIESGMFDTTKAGLAITIEHAQLALVELMKILGDETHGRQIDAYVEPT